MCCHDPGASLNMDRFSFCTVAYKTRWKYRCRWRSVKSTKLSICQVVAILFRRIWHLSCSLTAANRGCWSNPELRLWSKRFICGEIPAFVNLLAAEVISSSESVKSSDISENGNKQLTNSSTLIETSKFARNYLQVHILHIKLYSVCSRTGEKSENIDFNDHLNYHVTVLNLAPICKTWHSVFV